MKNIRFTLLAFLFVVLGLASCKKEDPEVLDVENLTLNLTNTNFQNGQVIGTVKASTNKGNLTYSITSQLQQANGSIAAGLSINSATGEVTVTNRNGIYDTGCPNQQKYTAVVTISNGSISKTVNITMDLGCVS